MKKKKIVINGVHGGFGLSPEATLWLFKNGCKDKGFKTPVEKYYTDNGEFQESLNKWREYLKGNKDRSSLFLIVFSPCEKFVLYARNVKRDNPLLIKCVEELGEKADGHCAGLRIVEIPSDVKWSIEEYDGLEWIAEKHRRWE